MFSRGLLRNVEIVPSTNASIGAKSTLFSSPVNMTDAEGCLFILNPTSQLDALASSKMAMHLQKSTNGGSGSSDWTNIGSTSVLVQTTQATGYTGHMMILDAVRCRHPYLRVGVSRSSGWLAITQIKYGLRRLGSTQALDDTIIGKWSVQISAT